MTNACLSAVIARVFFYFQLAKTSIRTPMYCQTLQIFGMQIQQFLGIEPWGGDSKNLVHLPHKTLFCILSRIL
jgi:hypothetical protein